MPKKFLEEFKRGLSRHSRYGCRRGRAAAIRRTASCSTSAEQARFSRTCPAPHGPKSGDGGAGPARSPRHPRRGRLGAGINAVFPAEPVWYLQVLGVHPDAQRRAIGHQLLGPVLAAADRTAASCYLETAAPRNVAYYQRFGFSPAGPPAPPHPGGPPMTRMTRPAGAPPR